MMNHSIKLLGAGTALGIAIAALVSACSTPGTTGRQVAGREAPMSDAMSDVMTVDGEDRASVDRLLDEIQGNRVVLVGESHDRYDHHLNQLAVIRGLHERGLDVAIGMEFFQVPFQQHLDDYVSGKIDEREMLERTRWDERWRFDIRLYRDILDYARRHRIPLLALNPASELVAEVSKGGAEALGADERRRLGLGPDDDTTALRARMQPVFEAHGMMDPARFERFVDVQRLWDAHMARTAADFLEANPNRHLVILAGSGHVVPPEAIAGRIAAMGYPGAAVVATGPAEERFDDDAPAYLFIEREVELGSSG